jgi:predicted DNA-binding transcriptional regulator AlpA
MNMNAKDTLLRVGEVAEIIGCAKSTVWRRSAAGTLPAPIKIGHSARWSELEILAAIEEAKAQRASPDV